MPDDDETLVRRFIGGQHSAADEIRQRTTGDNTPILLVAAAYLDGQHERLDALVRDHLADHPGNILAAWIAAQPGRPVNPTAPTTTPHR